MRFQYTIKPRRIAFVFGTIAVFIAAQSLYTEYLVETFVGANSISVLGAILDLFSVNLEQSIPTWYSASILVIAAALLAFIATAKKAHRDRDTLYWFGLAVIFVYLSMDESAVIHEILSDPLQTLFHSTGYLAFGWQIAAAPLVAIFALVYLRFLLRLPADIRKLFVLAGVLYVGGALIVDAISANKWVQNQGITLFYLGIGTLEELMEMMGIVVFIYALLRYMVSLDYAVAFQSRQAATASTAAPAAQGPIQPDPSAVPSGSAVRSSARLAATALIAIMIVVNATFFYCAKSEESSAPPASPDSGLAYEAILAQPGGEQIVITRVKGMFGMEPDAFRQAAADLGWFSQVMVVTLPSEGSTLILAADTLPFDQSSLTDILHANGVTQFIVFDTPAVQHMTISP